VRKICRHYCYLRRKTLWNKRLEFFEAAAIKIDALKMLFADEHSPSCYYSQTQSNNNTNQMSIVTSSNFSVSNLKVDATKKQLDNSPAAIVYLNYNGGKLRVQAPRMPVPFDSGDFQGNGKYKLNLDFKNRGTSAKVASYFDMLRAIDDYVIDQGVKNAANWLGLRGVSRETVSALYTKSIRISKDKQGNDRAPIQSVALKKNFNTGVFDAALYDDQNRKIEGVTPMEVLRRGAEVTCILDATSIWVAGGKFGISWKLHQARVDQAAETSTSAPAFVDDDAENDAPVAAPAPAAFVADDEAEEEEEEEEVAEPVPVPAPAPAPKKVVKKAAPRA